MAGNEAEKMKTKRIVITPCKPVCVLGLGGECLSVDDDRLDDFWLAVKSNNAETMNRLLVENFSLYNKDHICKADMRLKFLFKGADFSTFIRIRVSTPLCIAAAQGASKVLQVFIDHGADLNRKDSMGKNLIHSLIYSSYGFPEHADAILETYNMLQRSLSQDQLRCLLLEEDDFGYHPLELAAHLAQFKLMSSILSTEGVYVSWKGALGLYSVSAIDITRYEILGKEDSRVNMSPILFLTYVEDRNVNDDFCELLAQKHVQLWCENKIRSSYIPLLIVFVYWLLFSALFFLWVVFGGELDYNEREELLYNSTSSLYVGVTENIFNGTASVCMKQVFGQAFLLSSIGSLSIEFILALLCFFSLVWSVIESFYYRKLKKPLTETPQTKNRSYFVAANSFFLMKTILKLGMIIRPFIRYLPNTKALSNFLSMSNTLTLTWTMLYFLQIVKYLGPTVIRLQLLLPDLVHFLTIFVLLLVPFSVAFNTLIITNINGPCDKRFATGFWGTFYSIFTVAFNMVDFSGLELREPVSVYLLHFFFVFLIAVLLLNFLIGRFTEKLSVLDKRGQAVELLHQLTLTYMVMNKIQMIWPALHNRLVRRHFAYDEETGKVFLGKLASTE